MQYSDMNDVVTLRRKNLRRLIDEKYNGSQAMMVDAIDINQGELSSLLKTKSFGEKKARSLEIKAWIPNGWLDTDHDNDETVNTDQVNLKQPANDDHGSGALSPDELAMLQKYRQLSQREKTAAQAVVDAFIEPTMKKSNE